MRVRLPSAAFILVLAMTALPGSDTLAQSGGTPGNQPSPAFGRGHYGGGGSHHGNHDSPFDDLNVGIILTPDWVNGWGNRPGYSPGGYYPQTNGGYAQPALDQPPFYYGQPAPNYYSPPPPAAWSQSQYLTPQSAVNSQSLSNQRNPAPTQSAAQAASSTESLVGNSFAPAYQPTAEATTPSQPQRRRSILIRPESEPALAQTLAADSAAQSDYTNSLTAFAEGNYQAAADAAQLAVNADGENGKLLLYLAQCQFAVGQHAEAADSLISAFQRLPREQWGLVVENFRQFYKRNDYVPHVERLLTFSEQPGNRSLGYALQAYHYHYLGHPDAATRQLQIALQESSPASLAVELKSLLLAATSPAAEGLPSPDSDN